MFASRRTSLLNALAATVLIIFPGVAARAQALAVLPVNIQLAASQRATTVGVTNQGTSTTAIQIRVYAWSQKDGVDTLVASDAVIVSPPLASIPAGSTQVIRLILRHPAEGVEATYRILIDQIPPPAETGVVHVVLRLSIPIFVQPVARTTSHLLFHWESSKGEAYLVGVNSGLRHESIRDIVLLTSTGRKLQEYPGASPYVLAGATRRWHMNTADALPLSNENLQLTAHGDNGAIEQRVPIATAP